jgi:hypothetical protein
MALFMNPQSTDGECVFDRAHLGYSNNEDMGIVEKCLFSRSVGHKPCGQAARKIYLLDEVQKQ